ncbi:hypothetical protein CJ195_20950 [Bacillus sp. UMB0899]|nr:hypothetical protein CJ195_20950 [Bacillus sp. UMB0899]
MNWPFVLGSIGLVILFIYYRFYSGAIDRQVETIYEYFNERNIEVLYVDFNPLKNRSLTKTYSVLTRDGEYLIIIKRLQILIVQSGNSR